MYSTFPWKWLGALIFCISIQGHAQRNALTPPSHHHHPSSRWHLQLDSFETEVTGTLTLTINLQGPHLLPKEHRFQLNPGPKPAWLKNWHAEIQPQLLSPGKKRGPKDATLELRYNQENLPYTYRRFQLSLVGSADQKLGTTVVYVYFTPYDTVEVWNQDDFENLNRRWDRPQANERPRQKLARSSLPAEAWSAALFTGDTKPTRMFRTPGLAYAVPMPVNAMPQHRLSAAKNDFEGTVEGQIVTVIHGSDLSIVDIEVEVWESDLINGDTFLATGYTGEDGLFSIDFSTSQAGQNAVEVYVQVHSRNERDLIRVRTRLGVIRNESNFSNLNAVFLPDTPRTHDFGRIEMDPHEAKPQLLHWANRARQFVDSEMPTVLPTDSSNRLDIMRSFSGSDNAYFFPGGYVWDLIFVSAFIFGQVTPIVPILVGGAGAIFISNKDGIYFGADRELYENVVYHEFGHYFMWHLQNESWIDIIEAGFSHHSIRRNNPNPKLSWTEGFASGFANIIDTWCYDDDGERFLDGYNNADYERRIIDGDYIQELPSLHHGFVSEYNNGTILYDLWDGPTQVLRDGTTLTNTFDYDDNGDDTIELSFAQIMQPLRNHQGTGGFHMDPLLFGIFFGLNQEVYLLTDITEYHAALLDLASIDRDLGKEITNLFNNDYVKNFDPNADFFTQDQLSSDFLAFVRPVTNTTYDQDGNPNGTATHNFSVDVSELRQEDDEFNIAQTAVGSGDLFLSDDLLVTGTPGSGSAKLHFNGNMNFGWQDNGNSFGTPAFGYPAVSHLDLDLCGNMTLEINEGGRVLVGSTSGPTATITLKSGSTLILGGDDSGQILDLELTYGTMVSMGTLTIRNHSRFIVEEGATLIFNRGGNLHLPGPNSVLEIHGDLIVAESANFRPEGNGKIIFGLPNLGGAPNLTVNQDSLLTFFEFDIQILTNTYVRPNDHSTVRVSMQFGDASMGENSYFHTGIGPLFVQYWHVFPTQPQTLHQGLWVNNSINSIEDSTFRGGAPGVWALHTSAPVILRDCEFQTGTQGILADPGDINWIGGEARGFSFAGIQGIQSDIYVEDVRFFNNGLGLHTEGGSGRLDSVDIFQGGTGWKALNPTSDLTLIDTQIYTHAGHGMEVVGHFIDVNLSRCEIFQNLDGVRATGELRVKVSCTEVSDNAQYGFFMGKGALFDASSNSYLVSNGNSVNLMLEDAAEPELNYGQNFWSTTSPGDFNIQGTVRGGICECNLDLLGNCLGTYYFANITGDLFFFQNTFTTPGIGQAIDITDLGTGNCSYIPNTTPATQNCGL